ncbi:H-NS family nucleoid-associated regulatory protein [Caballeronia novacaledonica]|uniref:H-NS histone family protein n=1 Tax=Caballeronia novacaledonica TaxID=1544861 RepID=UPI003CCBADC6
MLIEMVAKMREYGISLNELMGRKPGAQPDEPSAKYRDPVSGLTWSGRGRTPGWIAGKDRNEFLIDRHPAARPDVQPALFSERQ